MFLKRDILASRLKHYFCTHLRCIILTNLEYALFVGLKSFLIVGYALEQKLQISLFYYVTEILDKQGTSTIEW